MPEYGSQRKRFCDEPEMPSIDYADSDLPNFEFYGRLITKESEQRRAYQAIACLDSCGYISEVIEGGRLRIKSSTHFGRARGPDALWDIGKYFKSIIESANGSDKHVEVDVSNLEITVDSRGQEILRAVYCQYLHDKEEKKNSANS